MPVSAVMICDFLEPHAFPSLVQFCTRHRICAQCRPWAANPNTENSLGFSPVDNSPFLVSIWYQTRPELQFGTAVEWQSQALAGRTASDIRKTEDG